jgi:hypothetical protein
MKTLSKASPNKKPRTKIEEGGETFPLSAELAEQLGDVPAGTMITLKQFQRCLYRLADIRSGRVKKPNQFEGN